MKKVDYPVDKNEWHPSLIAGSIVLISTYNSKKEPNVAPKSWLQMVSFNPPIIMFSGTKGNQTENNIMKTKCFGVNFVDSSMASTVYKCTKWSGKQRILKSGFKLTEAPKINAPLVDNCKAHLECRLHSTKTVGKALIIFGEIVAALIWGKIPQQNTRKCTRFSIRLCILNPACSPESTRRTKFNGRQKPIRDAPVRKCLIARSSTMVRSGLTWAIAFHVAKSSLCLAHGSAFSSVELYSTTKQQGKR